MVGLISVFFGFKVKQLVAVVSSQLQSRGCLTCAAVESWNIVFNQGFESVRAMLETV